MKPSKTSGSKEPTSTNSLVPIERSGRDEMNLVEYPFATLRLQGQKDKVIEHRWPVDDPLVPGRTLEAVWRVAGDPILGLPTATDEKVYLVLMEITREIGWPREVSFSPSDLLRRLNWPDNATHYKMLRQAFERMKAMNVTARWCFWDNSGRRLKEQVGFSIIDKYSWDTARGRRKQGQLPLSFFVWSEDIHNSIRANYVRPINLDFALSLERPLSLRLFRYLDKRKWSKNGPRSGYTEGLKKMCEKHLGVTATAYESTMKRTLEPAHKELISRGFLRSVDYVKMSTQEGVRVVYRFGDRVLPKAQANTASIPPSAAQAQGEAMPEDEFRRVGQVVLSRLQAEDAEEWQRLYEEAVENLGPADVDRLQKEPNSPLVARTIEYDMMAMAEIEYLWMFEEERGK